jgi:hypothetical protein
MLRHDAKQHQNEVASHVARLRFEAGGSAECMVLAVEHQKASGMEITGTALGQMTQPMPHALSVYWQGWHVTEHVNSVAQRGNLG